MKRIISNILLLATTLSLAACNDDDIKVMKQDAPLLVSSTPSEGGHVGVGDSILVTLTYDKNILFYCGDADQIELTNGSVVGAEVFGSSQTLSVLVACPDRDQDYTLRIPAGLVKGANDVSAPSVTLNFSTRIDEISNPSATDKTKRLYTYMNEIYGEKILSAMMANVNWNNECSEEVAEWTGSYPAINCYDFIHFDQSWIDYTDLSPVTDWVNNGGIVAANWHWMVPNQDPSTTSYGNLSLKAYNSTTIWEGSEVIGNWGTLQLEADLFTNAQVGQYIRVAVTDLGSDATGALKTPSEGWPFISEKEYDYFSISGDYVVEITETILGNLEEYGLLVTGTNYTCVGVYLEDADYSEGYSEELWSGSYTWDDPNWQITWVDITSDQLADIQVGMYIRVHITNVGSSAAIAFCEANDAWDKIDGEDHYNISGDFALEITTSNIDNIKNGLHIGGYDFTIVGVCLENTDNSYSNDGSGDESTSTSIPLEYSYEPGKGFSASNAATEGTWENQYFYSDLDKLSEILALIAKEDIPILWRPFHEASGQWFWWGENAESHKQLWKMMYDYLVNEKGLNNLIWVWTTEGDDADWYPGDEYVDIVGCDLYGNNAPSCFSSFSKANNNFGNKMITLSECGYTSYDPAGTVAPISEQWEAGAKWLWFMPWYSDDSTTHADESWWQDAMNQDYVITRDQVKY